jgi:hypothetical protein
MSWYPGARKMELQPESDAQVAIVPTQFIMHSIAAPWDENRIFQYWGEPGINLESHFGLSYLGGLGQYIGTQTRADANAQANSRAVSIETESNTKHTDPWTDAQIRELIDLGVWLHHEHTIPLRICRTWTDPGYGYHGLFREWSTSGTACPGEARIRQFRDVVFPGIVRAAQNPGTTLPDTGDTEDDMKILGGELKPGFDPIGNLIIPPSFPAGRKAFVNIGVDMVSAAKFRVDVFAGGKWKLLGIPTVGKDTDLAFYPLPEGTRKINIKRLPGDGVAPDAPASWNVEVI